MVPATNSGSIWCFSTLANDCMAEMLNKAWGTWAFSNGQLSLRLPIYVDGSFSELSYSPKFFPTSPLPLLLSFYRHPLHLRLFHLFPPFFNILQESVPRLTQYSQWMWNLVSCVMTQEEENTKRELPYSEPQMHFTVGKSDTKSKFKRHAKLTFSFCTWDNMQGWGLNV